jgi:hypothetical protein
MIIEQEIFLKIKLRVMILIIWHFKDKEFLKNQILVENHKL